MRIALGVEYFGSGFHGWQSQLQGGTVQDALEAALREIAGLPIGVICAGRTDAGVHASHQVVHFDAPVERPLTAWVRGVNSHLPEGVAVRWAQAVDPEFHARFSARGRRYRYLLLNRPQRPGLWAGRVGWFHGPLELGPMQEAARGLLGEHDFSAFRAAGCQAKTPVKTLWRADVRQQGSLFVFDFEASAFLHHMVRNLVGSLVYIGKGTQSPAWIDELLLARDRKQAAPTFSPDGLYFRGPIYEPHWGLPDPDDDFLDGVLK
ncbi:tRNA pseudouridine(38-40) synthase TruA [Dechloromonas denitrificans]|uniref:tRNA pseudouridine(38-40) synthase TruA n=1 Tax=Dechloromonas denitrificans TaxID=281362 RepID=UPI001CF8CB84|nr:tRNA pseudouridine(38-40) synthase TruA [Dechloromonas denitrificans]UCV02860.1 tRNA pseudouridine(38-40) synthase TruA [Dechloromonas denitrificans]UCV07168.1 tRNA pseudouridine(38-40) synthase TruA [Dechloromonas denitrificans]